MSESVEETPAEVGSRKRPLEVESEGEEVGSRKRPLEVESEGEEVGSRKRPLEVESEGEEVGSRKRPLEVESGDEEEDEFIGPQPVIGDAEAGSEGQQEEEVPVKKKRVLEYESLYLSNLPDAEYYEKSYMHRDVISHIVVTKTDFIITGSVDGHVKFWKKQDEGIEFVKHFRCHLGNIQGLSANHTGILLCSVSNDKSIKIFDVVNFDMINMIKADYVPLTCEWIHHSGDAVQALAVSDEESGTIYVYDGRQDGNEPLKKVEGIHRSPVPIIRYNPVFDSILSVDSKGMIEYWTGHKNDYRFPKNVLFESKLDTDLFEFVKDKLTLHTVCLSPNGKLFAALTSNKKIYLFDFLRGKKKLVIDESIHSIQAMQQAEQLLPTMDFGRRMATEKELEKSDFQKFTRMTFDESSNFLLYPTIFGVKVVNLVTNALMRFLGKPENMRILSLSLFQGRVKKPISTTTVELEAADNPTLDSVNADPTLFCTSYKKNRFYMFTQRDYGKMNDSTDRDVFNEKPSKEEIISATDDSIGQKIYDTATIHTTKGDVTIRLFGKECPRTVENFCVHAKNGYYNGHIFHRVIKGFMLQTGDPTGVGTGGESIWGGEFEDEFHPTLKHDRPYTISMANAGPNTNGSQFFMTVIPTPWLDGKHTVFGRVVRGMETVQNISLVKTNPKTDKPYDDVAIVNISLK